MSNENGPQDDGGGGGGSSSSGGDDRATRLKQLEQRLKQKQRQLSKRQEQLDEREAKLDRREAELDERNESLLERREEAVEIREEVEDREARLDERKATLDDRETALAERERELDQREAELDQQEATLESYVGDRMADLEESIGDTIQERVASAVKQHAGSSSGAFSVIRGVVIALVGLLFVVAGIANGFATEMTGVPQLFTSTTANYATTAVLVFVGFAANLAAAAGRA